MSQYLRQGNDVTEDEYSETETVPKIENPLPKPNKQKEKAIKAPSAVKPVSPKIPKVHVCEHCGEHFATNSILTRHINELRCPVRRQQSMQKEINIQQENKG